MICNKLTLLITKIQQLYKLYQKEVVKFSLQNLIIIIIYTLTNKQQAFQLFMITEIDPDFCNQQYEQFISMTENSQNVQCNVTHSQISTLNECEKNDNESTMEDTLRDLIKDLNQQNQSSQQCSQPNQNKKYEFRLKSQNKKSKQSNLASAMANRYPPKIRTEVIKMIDYYEKTLKRQRQMYHKAVQKNSTLQKQNKKRQNSSQKENIQSSSCKETGFNTFNQRTIQKSIDPLIESNQNIQEDYTQKKLQLTQKRNCELEKLLVEKDNKIVQLSRQTTELLLKYRKTKKMLKQKQSFLKIEGSQNYQFQ